MAIEEIVLAVILLGVSIWADAKQDLSGRNLFEGEEKYKNRSESWHNKYAFPLIPNYKHWYYLSFRFKLFNREIKFNGIFQPKYKEAFPFSTTILAAFTDYWHWMQFIHLNTIYFSISLFAHVPLGISTLLTYCIIRFIYMIIFNLTFEK